MQDLAHGTGVFISYAPGGLSWSSPGKAPMAACHSPWSELLLWSRVAPVWPSPRPCKNKLRHPWWDFWIGCGTGRKSFLRVHLQIFLGWKELTIGGKEIKLARSFSWQSIAAAFPPEVATLDILDFCTGRCRNYVMEFEKFLLPEDQRRLGRTPRTMVADEDWPEVCAGLLRSGICGVLPQQSLFHVDGRPVFKWFIFSFKEWVPGLGWAPPAHYELGAVERVMPALQGGSKYPAHGGGLELLST